MQPKTIGEPYTGNLYVRFDEGGGLNPHLYSNVLCGCKKFLPQRTAQREVIEYTLSDTPTKEGYLNSYFYI
jgi:hypothetical protein